MKPAGWSPFRLPPGACHAAAIVSAVAAALGWPATAAGQPAAVGALGQPAGEGDPAGSGATDIVFIVDSSGSSFRSDPDGARKLLIEAFTSFAWDRAGDRIAVAQFAGWEETSHSEDVVVFPLAKVPAKQEERASFMDGLRTSLEKMKPFGVGTDPNAALELVLPAIERQREKEREKPAEPGRGLMEPGPGPEEAPPEEAPPEEGAPGDAPPEEVPPEEAPPEEGAPGDAPPEEGAPGDAAPEGAAAAENKLWAIVVTDGDINVVEGATARDIYIQRAEENHGTATPETLALVASEIFFNEALPRLRERGVTVTPVGLGRREDEPGPFFERVKEAIGANVLYVDGPLLGRAFTGLVKNQPGRPPSEAASYDYTRATVEPAAGDAGGEQRVPFRLLPETRRTRAVFFGSSGEYSIAVARAGGGELGAAEAPKDLAGVQGPFRILELAAAPAGEYEFVVKSASEGPLEVEVTLYPDVVLDVAVADGEGGFKDGAFTSPAGRPFACAVSVHGAGGEVVKNPAALPELEVTLEMAEAAESTGILQVEPVARRVTFAELPEARTQAELGTERFGVARSRLTVQLRAFPVKGDEGETLSYIYEGPLKEFDVTLVTAVVVEFGTPEAFVGQIVPLEGSFTVPVDILPEEVVAPITPGDRNGTLKKVAEAGKDTYRGTVRFPEPGEWSIARADGAEFLVVPGDGRTVSVRERRMLLLSHEPPHEELASLDFTVRFHEAAGPYELPVLLQIDVGPNEVPEFPPSVFVPCEELAALGLDSPLEIKLGAAGEPQAGLNRFEGKAVLNVTTDEWLPKSPGSVELAARVEDVRLTKSVEVTLTFSDFWKKLVLMTWYIWGPALLVLLLILWWLLLARFNRQVLYIVSRLEQPTGPFHLLRDLCEGPKRQAFGTPEVENVAQFRMRGTKIFGGRVSVCSLREGAVVAASNVQASSWVRLHNGDEIVAENPEGAYCRYWYFDRAPSEEEIQGMLAADAVELGPNEFVIEGL